MKKFLTAIAFSALALPAQAFDITDMNAEERDAFRAEVRAYLLDNPQIILEAYQAYEQRQAVAEAERDRKMVLANADAIFNDGSSWVGGNPDGDITMVEFIDYRCSYCRKAHDEVKQLLETDGNIRFIVKEFPILGDESVLGSRFAIATKMAEGDDAYDKIKDALIKFRGKFNEKSLSRLAESLDLDGKAILKRMSDPEIDQIIGQNHMLAQKLGISGTPTFVLGQQMLRGYVPLNNMIDLVAATRAQK